jgi:hypothetical protein
MSFTGNHSAKFAPAIQPTLRTAVEAFIVAALTAFESSASEKSQCSYT